MEIYDSDYIDTKACKGNLTHINGIPILLCDKHGVRHIYPYPDVDEYYDNDKFYAEHSPDDWFELVEKDHKLGLWDTAYNYRMSFMNTDLPLLDVGSGAGRFLFHYIKNANEVNWHFGIEPSETAINKMPNLARAFSKIYRSYEDFDKEGYQIDEDGITNIGNIHMALVLEHIPNPADFIAKYFKYQSIHGTMCIVVPNDFSPLQRRLKSYHYISPVHVNYFSPDSLRQTIAKALYKAGESYQDVEIIERATFPMELFQLMGIKYIDNDQLGRKLFRLKARFEQALGFCAFEIYRHLYEKYGWGRELMFFVRRKRA